PGAAPAGHVVRLGQRVEFDRDVTRAVDLEDARRHVAVERHLGVRVVEYEQDVELATFLDDALEIVTRRDRGGGIVGIVEIQDFCASQNVGGNVVEVDEKVGPWTQRVLVDLASREQR